MPHRLASLFRLAIYLNRGAIAALGQPPVARSTAGAVRSAPVLMIGLSCGLRLAIRLLPTFPMRLLAILLLSSCVGLSMVAAVPGRAEQVPPPPEEAPVGERLAALIERMRYENTRLQTLEAKFVQIKESVMLVEPEEANGVLFYDAPDQVRWEYKTPNPISILIGDERMTTWYRDLGRAEQVDVGRKSQKIMRYMGAANSIETLLEYFTVRLKMPTEPAAPYSLHLIPRYEQVAKRLQEMRVNIDRELFIPVYLRYIEADGDTTEYRFEDLEINRELPEDTFHLDLPDSVELRVLKSE